MSPSTRRTFALFGALVLTLASGMTAGVSAQPPGGYRILSVVVTSAGPDGVGCEVNVTATFRLPEASDATYLRFSQFRFPDIASSTPTPEIGLATQVGTPPASRPWDVRWQLSQTFHEVRLDNAEDTWMWGAQILGGTWDGEWHTTPLSTFALTKHVHGQDGICPPVGKVIAKGH